MRPPSIILAVVLTHLCRFLIISSFTTALELVDDYLRSNNVSATRYQGDMTRLQRDESVRSVLWWFLRAEELVLTLLISRILGKSKKCFIMLMSLKCGGVGLNLVRYVLKPPPLSLANSSTARTTSSIWISLGRTPSSEDLHSPRARTALTNLLKATSFRPLPPHRTAQARYALLPTSFGASSLIAALQSTSTGSPSQGRSSSALGRCRSARRLSPTPRSEKGRASVSRRRRRRSQDLADATLQSWVGCRLLSSLVFSD